MGGLNEHLLPLNLVHCCPGWVPPCSSFSTFFPLQLDLITPNSCFISSSKLYNDIKGALFLKRFDFLAFKSEFQTCFHPQEGSVQTAEIRGTLLICRRQAWTTLAASSQIIDMTSSDTGNLLSSHVSVSFWTFSVKNKQKTESP